MGHFIRHRPSGVLDGGGLSGCLTTRLLDRQETKDKKNEKQREKRKREAEDQADQDAAATLVSGFS